MTEERKELTMSTRTRFRSRSDAVIDLVFRLGVYGGYELRDWVCMGIGAQGLVWWCMGVRSLEFGGVRGLGA